MSKFDEAMSTVLTAVSTVLTEAPKAVYVVMAIVDYESETLVGIFTDLKLAKAKADLRRSPFDDSDYKPGQFASDSAEVHMVPVNDMEINLNRIGNKPIYKA